MDEYGMWRIEVRRPDGSDNEIYLQGGETQNDALFRVLRHYADSHGIDTEQKLLELHVTADKLTIQEALRAQQQ